MVRGITFDFWDCIVADDSDEPKRAARGLPTKAEARKQSFVSEVLAHHPAIGETKAAEACDHANAWFRHAWKVEHHTPTVAERLHQGFVHLGIEHTPGFDAMVATWERMEVELPPDLNPGIGDALATLSKRMPIGIVSDAIVTPGTGLREILGDYGLLQYFTHFVFSDEAGASKPDRKVFELASAGLDVPIPELVHIGDREYNDIGGPLGCGAKAILYTGAIDRGSATTRAHAVCGHYDELPDIVAGL